MQERVTAAYKPGEWEETVPLLYEPPHPHVIPQLQQMHVDLPMLRAWPARTEAIPFEALPRFDPEVERQNITDQAELFRRIQEEQDEFGDDFHTEKEETRELRESLEALGE